ncbi:hypothetical protein CBR_g19711 [Chara braunii]|uniref:Uncharacterized protein n=1 Tax=Chara braunii TaxID=69332 RepID=A0A388KYV0_CHABU|nr:hypothetical protein CBR_g19711 [Chara braunii]|eukprot:GBG75198.1 hypothetical protein CBR_g19711 [Chara braunii]
MKSSASGEPRMSSEFEKLGRNVASLQEYVQLERSKQDEKEAQKKAKKLAKQKPEEEKIEREQRVARKKAKVWKAEERELKLAKNVDMQLSLKIGELRDEIRQELRRVMTGKSKAKNSSGASGCRSNGDIDGGSEDLSARTKQLTINEKRKRGAEPVFEDSPPMVVPSKRTPGRRLGIKPIRLTPRLKSRTPKVKSRSTTKPKSRQASNMKIPAECGELGRLRYLDAVRRDLIDLDAKTMEALCKNEVIEYRGKINVIFDIADHKAAVAYDSVHESEEVDKAPSKEEAKAEGDIIEGTDGDAEETSQY